MYLLYPVLKISLLLTTCLALEKHCSVNQTQRFNYFDDPICCFNITCEAGSNQVPESCDYDGGTDTCSDCPDNSCNAARINSFDIKDFSDLCRRLDELCDTSTLGGTLIYLDKTTCEVTCKCNRLKGFYRFNPHFRDCAQSNIICDDMTTWLNDSGQCEKCQDGYVQDKIFGECVPIERANYTTTPSWSYTDRTVKSINTTTSTPTNHTVDGHRADEQLAIKIGIPVGVFVTVLLAIGAFLMLRGMSKRRSERTELAQSHLRFPNPNPDILPPPCSNDNEEYMLHPIGNIGNTVVVPDVHGAVGNALPAVPNGYLPVPSQDPSQNAHNGRLGQESESGLDQEQGSHSVSNQEQGSHSGSNQEQGSHSGSDQEHDTNDA